MKSNSMITKAACLMLMASLFGMTVDEVDALYAEGYDPKKYYEADPRLKACIAFCRQYYQSLNYFQQLYSLILHL